MWVLVIKTSSMGDVLHALPAVTDAAKSIAEIRFDWVVEEDFAEIPLWHPAVDSVIPVSMRRWRRHPGQWLGRDVRRSLGALRNRRYTHVIDAQGLLKSAFLAGLCRGTRSGFSYHSAREPLSALAYAHRVAVPGELHAIERVRRLFAAVLGYPCPTSLPDFGIDPARFTEPVSQAKKFLAFVHAATWQTKLWPEPYWHRLIELAEAGGYAVRLPWGNELERQQAGRISSGHPNAEVLPELGLHGLACVLASAAAVVSVDTGPAHLTAALATPSVSIYGATDPGLTGTLGADQQHLRADFPCSPCLAKRCTYTEPAAVEPACYSTVSPDQVWVKLLSSLQIRNQSKNE